MQRGCMNTLYAARNAARAPASSCAAALAAAMGVARAACHPVACSKQSDDTRLNANATADVRRRRLRLMLMIALRRSAFLGRLGLPQLAKSAWKGRPTPFAHPRGGSASGGCAAP